MNTCKMLVCALLLTALTCAACALTFSLPSTAEAKGVVGEYYEGKAEIRREREEMRRDILNSDSRWEAKRAYRQGMREIQREKREMRRETRRAYRGW